MTDLYKLFDDDIQIIQYADEIYLYVFHNSYDKCLKDLKHTICVLRKWLADKTFFTCSEKSVLICFRYRLLMTDHLFIEDAHSHNYGYWKNIIWLVIEFEYETCITGGLKITQIGLSAMISSSSVEIQAIAQEPANKYIIK